MKNYIEPDSPLSATVVADTSSGDLVKVGSLIGVAAGDAATGDAMIVHLMGVFEVPKLASERWPEESGQGDKWFFCSRTATVPRIRRRTMARRNRVWPLLRRHPYYDRPIRS